MKEIFRDKTRDGLTHVLNSIGIKAEIAERDRAEEKVEDSWHQRSLGVIDIPEGAIRWINVLKQDGGKNNPPKWWIVMGIPDESSASISKQIKIKTKRKSYSDVFLPKKLNFPFWFHRISSNVSCNKNNNKNSQKTLIKP